MWHVIAVKLLWQKWTRLYKSVGFDILTFILQKKFGKGSLEVYFLTNEMSVFTGNHPMRGQHVVTRCGWSGYKYAVTQLFFPLPRVATEKTSPSPDHSRRHAEEGSVQSGGHCAGWLGPQGHHHRRERDARPHAPQVKLSTQLIVSTILGAYWNGHLNFKHGQFT